MSSGSKLRSEMFVRVWDFDEIVGTSVTKITAEINRVEVEYIGKRLQTSE